MRTFALGNSDFSDQAQRFPRDASTRVKGMVRRARQAATPLSPLAAEAEFERELEVFRTEAESAGQFFYAFLAIHAAAAAKRPVLNHINTAPLFWKTMLGALRRARPRL
ncbi:MAG: hypothetical protein GEU95_03780 [Rhizobiales bacterium]|nr:hypothetical protein [Hyphomicrobiales bacterium]